MQMRTDHRQTATRFTVRGGGRWTASHLRARLSQHSTGESAALIADFAEQTGVTYPLVPDVNFTRFALAFPSANAVDPNPAR